MVERNTCETFINLSNDKTCIVCYNYTIPEDLCETNCKHISETLYKYAVFICNAFGI